MIATCVCGWQTVCEPGDEHGPVTRLLEHREIDDHIHRNVAESVRAGLLLSKKVLP